MNFFEHDWCKLTAMGIICATLIGIFALACSCRRDFKFIEAGYSIQQVVAYSSPQWTK